MNDRDSRTRRLSSRRISGLPVLFVALWLSGAGGFGAETARSERPSFGSEIRPLLEAKCVRCHNTKVRKADLDLSTHAAIVKGGESGPAVVPGKPEESPLFEMVREGRMPADKKNRLDPGQVERIRLWIEAGALPGTAAPAPDPPATVAVTQHDVYPILLRRCVVCHGRDVREAGLDLRSRSTMLKGGKSGPAFVPSDPARSLVLERIRSGAMPPRRRVVEVSIKPIEPAEADLIARWIALGAPEVEIDPDVAGPGPDPLVTGKDRDWWSFRPPQPVTVPAAPAAGQVRNPIDAFLLRKLEDKGLTFSPEADRLTLLRRVTLDLTGLLPGPEELDAFLADRSPDAYERWVDRLLASPRHGERWARHWLDVAGYADSEGKREQDLPRPSAWRYRDYVVRAFNSDKPYDRFLLEQIAGDELADYEHAPEITPELEDNLVATGFLRMAPDPTWANPTNFIPDRIDVVADEIDVLGSGIMGLTLKCARCHSHKFDPIPQRDYYRLVAVLKGAYDENDWLRGNWEPTISKGRRADRELAYVTTAERRRWESRNAPVQREIESLRSRLESESKRVAEQMEKDQGARLPASTRDALAASGDGARHAALTFLRNRFDAAVREAAAPALKALSDQARREVAALEARLLPEPTIRALWDRGEPSPTYVYRRGDFLSPGRLVGPGAPSVLSPPNTPFAVRPPWPGARSTGRRLALARWLTRPDHPLTARVMVNRVWKHHFGAGLVTTLGNFGKAGTAPSHPELLDWLAREFVDHGWSVKRLHRLMTTSAAYRQSSVASDEARRLDPDNRLCSRRPLVRMEAEVLQDTLLQVAGRLDAAPFGPPDPVTVRADGLITPTGSSNGWRRSIYVRQDRKQVSTLLEAFDLPQMNPNCLERRESNVAPQALHLWNDGMVRILAEQFARRVESTAGNDPGRQVEHSFRVARGRPPDEEERAAALESLARLTAAWSRAPNERAPAARALATYCHALLNSATFLYID